MGSIHRIKGNKTMNTVKEKKQSMRPGKGGMIPPVDRRFGQPNANPRSNGHWKKEDTPRYKLEKMMKLTETELANVAMNPDSPFFERKMAVAISRGDWTTIERMINQVYGTPKMSVEHEGTFEVAQIIRTPTKALLDKPED